VLVAFGTDVSANDPQERLLDDVVGVRFVADDAIHVRSQPGRSAGMKGRERRLIETAHGLEGRFCRFMAPPIVLPQQSHAL